MTYAILVVRVVKSSTKSPQPWNRILILADLATINCMYSNIFSRKQNQMHYGLRSDPTISASTSGYMV